MAKTVSEAKELRQVFLMEFEAAVEDLQEMIDAGTGTIKTLKNSLGAVKDAYDEVMRSHAKLVTLEKTTSCISNFMSSRTGEVAGTVAEPVLRNQTQN